MSDTPQPKKKKAAKPAAPDAGAAAVQDDTIPKKKSDAVLKAEILAAALPDAAFDGFTEKVLEKAGAAAGADPAMRTRLFPDGPIGLIEYYSLSADAEMERQLAALDLPAMKIRSRIAVAVKTRIGILKPNKEAARRAGAMLSVPTHAGLAAKLLYHTVDAMWRAAGDTATDFNFYTKRGILAGVYGATLMRWFNDTSDDEAATDAFLTARIENVMQFEKFKTQAKTALANFPAFSNWGKPKEK